MFAPRVIDDHRAEVRDGALRRDRVRQQRQRRARAASQQLRRAPRRIVRRVDGERRPSAGENSGPEARRPDRRVASTAGAVVALGERRDDRRPTLRARVAHRQRDLAAAASRRARRRRPRRRSAPAPSASGSIRCVLPSVGDRGSGVRTRSRSAARAGSAVSPPTRTPATVTPCGTVRVGVDAGAAAQARPAAATRAASVLSTGRELEHVSRRFSSECAVRRASVPSTARWQPEPGSSHRAHTPMCGRSRPRSGSTR